MNVTRAVLPHFRSRGAGAFVNVSSVSGRMTFPAFSLYNASKWAVEGFSESLQHELRPLGIRVAIIEPGTIKTDFYDRSMDLVDSAEDHTYTTLTQRVLEKARQSEKLAATPERVARVILKAATGPAGRLRYATDWQGRFLLFARRVLPEALFNRIVRTIILR